MWVGLSRTYRRVHWFTDVMEGWTWTAVVADQAPASDIVLLDGVP